MKRLCLRTLGAASGAAVLAASPATADELRVDNVRVQAGPVLAGDAFLFAYASGNGAIVDRVPIAGGERTRLTSYFPRVAEARASVRALAASDIGFGAAIVTTGFPGEEDQRVVGGAFGAPTRTFGDCGRGAGVAVVGGRLAGDPCGVVVSDLVGGAPDRTVALQGVAPRAAGSLVAWRESRGGQQRVVVFDVDAGRTIRIFRAGRVPGELDDYDLRGDGTLALSYLRPRGGIRVATISPRGRLRTVKMFGGRSVAVRIHGGRIGFLQDRRGGNRAGVVTTAGRVRLLSRDARGFTRADFDFDGGRLAWRTGTANGVLLHVRDI